MTRAILFLTAITIASVSAGTISTLKGTQEPNTKRNVTKRQIHEFYPDWVPFKNKHGDDLGEFVDVTKPKAKVKKRLALPINFLMRAVADDIEDIGQGESDNDDEYYKKDTVNNADESVNPSKTSDIDGLIQIITQDTPSLADDINRSISKPRYRHDDGATESTKVIEHSEKPTRSPEPRTKGNDKNKLTDDSTESEQRSEAKVEEKLEDTTTLPKPKGKAAEKPKLTEQSDEDSEEETETTTTTKRPELSEEEQKENEKKKKIILDSVDQLKQRHEEEQRAISRKTLLEADEDDDDDDSRPRAKTTTPDYEEYEDSGSAEDKYRINIERKETTTTEAPTTQQPSRVLRKKSKNRDVRRKNADNKNWQQYSVFKNPELYTVENEGKHRGRLLTTPLPRRFSSKYVSTPRYESDENDVYPTLSSSEEEPPAPILYFPKMKTKRKPKKSKFIRTTSSAPDAYVAETVEDKLINKQTTLPIVYPTSAVITWSDIDVREKNKKDNKDAAAQDTTANGHLTTAEGVETGPADTGPSGEAASSNSETVTDAVPASSDHKKEEPKDYHVEKGGGQEHHSEFEEEHEEHGKKAYEGLHKDTKSKKGHHDKEDHHGKYDDHAGHDKQHHDESGHYGEHHHEEHGKKQAKYEESGKHSKGHSTKGSHDIHKKEEYEKNVEFFEEEGDSADEEKHGGYHDEKEHKAGGHFKKGNHHNGHHENKKGESGHFVKGGHVDVNKGHKSSAGHDSHGKHGGAHHAAGAHQSGKKWVYHHGHPAKNANLIVIDRRADRYMHGPTYYG